MDGSLVLTTNKISAEYTMQRLGENDYLVAPVIAIKEGVLNNELVREKEFSHHVSSWNGRPLVIAHPRQSGESISVNTPQLLKKHQIGQVHSAITEDGKLKAEAWINLNMAKGVEGGAEVINRIKKGTQTEVSTAYFRDLVKEPGMYNGQAYKAIAINLKPDHLAILLNEEGACSLEDGCGLPRTNEDNMKLNLKGTARTPKYEGVTSGGWNAPTLKDYLNAWEGDKPEDSNVDELPSNIKSWIAAHSLLGDADADNFRELSFFPVVNPATDKLSEHALDAVISGRGEAAKIPESAKKSAQNKARSLLNKEFDRELETNSKLEIALTKLNGLLDKIFTNKERNMDEKIKALIESDEVSFDEEALRGFSDCQIEELHGLIAQEEEPEEDPEEDPIPNEEEEETEDEFDTIREGFDKVFDEIGGISGLIEAIGKLKANSKQDKDEVVKRLTANKKCPLDEKQLEAMELDVLKALEGSYVSANYSALGELSANDKKEFVILDVPSLIEEGE